MSLGLVTRGVVGGALGQATRGYVVPLKAAVLKLERFIVIVRKRQLSAAVGRGLLALVGRGVSALAGRRWTVNTRRNTGITVGRSE